MRRFGLPALLSMLAACGQPSGEVPERRHDYVPVDSNTLPPPLLFDGMGGRPARIVYLHRDGGTYTAGNNDPANDVSSVFPEGVTSGTVPAFAGSDAEWTGVVACVRDQFADYNLEVVEVEPTGGDYIEMVLGGNPADVGADERAAGVAPVDLTTCRVIERAVGFVFTAKVGEDRIRAVCEVTTHEIGHALSLDHELLCEDPMSYQHGCGDKTFQDVDADCGEETARPCSCGRASQNSHQILHEKLGSPLPELADLVADRLEVTSTEVTAGERLSMTYARRNDGIVAASGFADRYVLIDHRGEIELRSYNRPTLAPGQTRGPYSVHLTVPADTPPGVYRLRYHVDHADTVEELDESNNLIERSVRVTAPVVTGPPDLVATRLTLDVERVAPGGRVRATYGRKNGGQAESGRFEDGYYLSTNSTITHLDRLLSSAWRGNLDPSQSVGPYLRTLTIPEDVTPGTYWVGYYVDHNRAVSESNESNNRRAVRLVVE